MNLTKRLPEPLHGLLKYGLPFVIVVGACVWVYWSDVRKGDVKSVWVYAFVGVVLVIIMYFVFRKGPWAHADAVEDLGHAIKVTRRQTTEVIPLSNIKSVGWVEYGYFQLEFERATAFGSSIQFVPQSSRQMRDIDDRLESLAARVQAKAVRTG